MSGPESKDVGLLELAHLFARAVGEERALELVTTAAQKAGCPGPELSRDEARRVLDQLASGKDVVATVARFARSRERYAGEPFRPPPPSSREPFMTLESIIERLAPSVGRERAQASVEQAAEALGLGARMTNANALKVLERVALEPGIVGVAARFAKVKLLLDGKERAAGA